eukprot:TRINITY_DN19834_c0_g1_i1.p1 TRINITY_DN19834_c0_g1~~TRINITY_DN19834_c0_g1_i1.p1  ORF type:complete len:109 (+),score=16.73 TRINITY_DN19834_c0_g1_i1:134-460(+)
MVDKEDGFYGSQGRFMWNSNTTFTESSDSEFKIGRLNKEGGISYVSVRRPLLRDELAPTGLQFGEWTNTRLSGSHPPFTMNAICQNKPYTLVIYTFGREDTTPPRPSS